MVRLPVCSAFVHRFPRVFKMAHGAYRNTDTLKLYFRFYARRFVCYLPVPHDDRIGTKREDKATFAGNEHNQRKAQG